MSHVPTLTLPDGQQVRLGMIPPATPPRVLRFHRYLGRPLAPFPPSVDNTANAMGSIQQMYGNDRYGDCVVAGKMHSVGVWSGTATGTPAVGTTDEAVQQYFNICGGGDQGCVITNVLEHMRTSGITVGGQPHRIDGYVSVDCTNKQEVMAGLAIFGTITIGINLPGSWTSSQVWDAGDYGFVGGHDVTLAGYNDQGVMVLTWGGIRTMTWAAVASNQYITEAYVPLSPDWYSKGNASPYGIKVDALQADLRLIEQGNVPPYDPGPGPGPGPNPDPFPPPGPGPSPAPWSWLTIG